MSGLVGIDIVPVFIEVLGGRCCLLTVDKVFQSESINSFHLAVNGGLTRYHILSECRGYGNN